MEENETHSETHYDVLGIQPDADLELIKERYRILAREVHPDLNPTQHDIGTFIKVRRAYETLKNKKRREEYDKSIGIYHTKRKDGVFLSDSSHQILRSKLDGLDLLDTDEDDDDIALPESLIKNDSKKKNLWEKFISFFKPEKELETHSYKRVQKNRFDIQSKKRSYQFSINHLESILGTERIIVLQEIDDQQNSIKVKIPPGTANGAILNVFHPVRGSIQVNIHFHDHPNIVRRDLSVTILVPFTATEHQENQTCKFFTCKGLIKLTIPANSTKALRAKGHGLKNKDSGEVGDFYFQPVLGGDKSAIERIKILSLLESLHDKAE